MQSQAEDAPAAGVNFALLHKLALSLEGAELGKHTSAAGLVLRILEAHKGDASVARPACDVLTLATVDAGLRRVLKPSSLLLAATGVLACGAGDAAGLAIASALELLRQIAVSDLADASAFLCATEVLAGIVEASRLHSESVAVARNASALLSVLATITTAREAMVAAGVHAALAAALHAHLADENVANAALGAFSFLARALPP